MAFSEAVKIKVRKRAHFSCCLCHQLEVEVHHIIPQAFGGPDTVENAAPLCASCHARYGANPEKRKFIREVRDHWYGICDRRYMSDPDSLTEIRRLLRQLTADRYPSDRRSSEPTPQLAERRRAQPALNIGSQQAKGISRSGGLHYELRGDPHELGVEAWIWSERSDHGVKLCDTEGWGNLRMHFAPNDRYIIVQDGGSSLGIHLRLFLREKLEESLRFREDESADIEGKAERLALKQAGFPEHEMLDHRYSHCWWWSDDSAFVLLSISGHGAMNGRGYRLEWKGLYCLETREATTDLRDVYENHVTPYGSR